MCLVPTATAGNPPGKSLPENGKTILCNPVQATTVTRQAWRPKNAKHHYQHYLNHLKLMASVLQEI